MRRLLTLLLAATVIAYANAQRITLDLQGASLAEALKQIDHAQSDRHLMFVYSDLENLTAHSSPRRSYVLKAVREACQGYPILITEVDDNILIEYVRPPMHLLPDVAVAGRHIQNDEAGYSVYPDVDGLNASALLVSLPDITMHDGCYFLNGRIRVTTASTTPPTPFGPKPRRRSSTTGFKSPSSANPRAVTARWSVRPPTSIPTCTI